MLIPERGIKVSNSDIVLLVKTFLQKMLKMRISRRDAFAETNELEIKYVIDPLKDTMKNEEGWIKISDINDINSISFETMDFYEAVSEDYVKELYETFKEGERKEKDERDRKKVEKSKKKEKKKESVSKSEVSSDISNEEAAEIFLNSGNFI